MSNIQLEESLSYVNSKLAAEWHPTKNGALTPRDVTAHSGKKVWWLLRYDDPNTGKHFDFEWEATVANRASGSGCPYLVGKAVWPGYNDLATKNPELASEWHPTKNGTLTPRDVTEKSRKQVYWYLPYDDPETGQQFDFEWRNSVSNHTAGRGCPYLVGKAVWPGYNDLATRNPGLASEWHPTKNGTLTPQNVTANSGKKVWWLLRYDDPNTGKHFDFEWEATVANRALGNGCPYLAGIKAWPGYNDLATTDAQLATEWHPTKNGLLTPKDVPAKSEKKVWWLLSYDDPETGLHFDFEWMGSVAGRIKGVSCPVLSGQAVWPGYNDLATKNPTLAAEWHPTKNGALTPRDVTAHSGKKVWWLLRYDDPNTGKHFDFEWQATVAHRVSGVDCPFLASCAVWPGYNDLATKNPGLASEWHPTKNGTLTPRDVTEKSQKQVYWYLPYDDPETGQHFDFEWRNSVSNRTAGKGCPYLVGQAVWPGYNDLATRNPGLASEWHPTKNGTLTPRDVTAHSGKKVWWLLRYDDPNTGKHFDFEWQATVFDRASGSGCPYLAHKAVWLGYNDLATKNPELASEWHPTKNGTLTPQNVTANSIRKVWWLLRYDDPNTGKHFDFEWKSSISNRMKVSGCPFLSNSAVWKGYNDLSTVFPELGKEWHLTMNGKLTPYNVTSYSDKKVWWLCPNCGKAWRASVYSRSRGRNCSCYNEDH